MQPALDGCPLGGTHNNVYTNGLHNQGLLATKHMLYSQLLAVCTGTVNQENATAVGCLYRDCEPRKCNSWLPKWAPPALLQTANLHAPYPPPKNTHPPRPVQPSANCTWPTACPRPTPHNASPPQTHCSLNRYWRAASTTVSLEQATDHLHPQLITEERPHCQTRMCNPTGVPLPKLCPAAKVLALSMLQGYYLLPPPTGATPGGAVLCCS